MTESSSVRWLLLSGSAAIVVLATLLTPSSESVALFGFEVPGLCAWRALTGLSCPGCGLTRSFAFLAHGDVVAAFRLHPLGPLLFAVVASQIPWQVYRIGVEGLAASRPVPGTAAPDARARRHARANATNRARRPSPARPERTDSG